MANIRIIDFARVSRCTIFFGNSWFILFHLTNWRQTKKTHTHSSKDINSFIVLCFFLVFVGKKNHDTSLKILKNNRESFNIFFLFWNKKKNHAPECSAAHGWIRNKIFSINLKTYKKVLKRKFSQEKHVRPNVQHHSGTTVECGIQT